MSFRRFMLCAAIVSLAASAQADNPWTYDERDDEIGRIYYYERTNTDGSMDERDSAVPEDIDPALRDQLEALGYLSDN